jgi:hypothetical protein
MQEKCFEVSKTTNSDIQRKLKNKYDTRAAAAVEKINNAGSRFFKSVQKEGGLESLLFGERESMKDKSPNDQEDLESHRDENNNKNDNDAVTNSDNPSKKRNNNNIRINGKNIKKRTLKKESPNTRENKDMVDDISNSVHNPMLKSNPNSNSNPSPSKRLYGVGDLDCINDHDISGFTALSPTTTSNTKFNAISTNDPNSTLNPYPFPNTIPNTNDINSPNTVTSFSTSKLTGVNAGFSNFDDITDDIYDNNGNISSNSDNDNGNGNDSSDNVTIDDTYNPKAESDPYSGPFKETRRAVRFVSLRVFGLRVSVGPRITVRARVMVRFRVRFL